MKLILASTSPRRIELLTQAGLKIITISPDADEARLRGESPRKMVGRLAKDKALSVLRAQRNKCQDNYDDAIILAADTIVLDPKNSDKVLGKPRDKADAISMLSRLSGNVHTVLTGYCLLWENGEQVLTKVVSSRVHIRSMSRNTIKRYVATGEPMDKAGSYAAQGLGMAMIDRINGSYTNVVGLPLSHVLADLEKITGAELFANHK